MEELIPDIVASIDAGIPVLAYPSIHNLNMGTIYGYDDGGVVWLLRDYFSVDGMTLVPAPDLGPVVLIPTHWEPPPPRRKALLDSIAMALRHWARRRGPDPDGPCFYGADALGQWAADLALVDDPAAGITEDERNNLFFVSWWNFCALEDARSAAVSFLEAAAADLSADATQHVLAAAEAYGREVAALCAALSSADAFLGPWTSKTIADWTPAVRARERELLSRAAALEAEAIEHLRRAAEAAS